MSDDETRRSWNAATRIHNAHKGDQAAFFRAGGDVLFPEELDLLGELEGRRMVHLQCNAGQDTLGLARRGARVVGVDFSGEAIEFARRLSAESGIAAEFEQAEVVGWMGTTPRRFELAFASYGVVGWLPDLDAWARGVARVLEPGGAFVYVEFHPLVWSLGEGFGLTRDDYFSTAPFREPVGDYVAASQGALGGERGATAAEHNTIVATSYQHGLGQLVTALVEAGLALDVLREYPHSNGCKVHDQLVPDPDRRWVFPPGVARVPLLFGLRCRKPLLPSPEPT